jgi:K+-transporting ATPase ATPase C chain
MAGARVLLGFTVLVGLLYPLAMTGISQVLFGWRADGSLVTADGSHTRDRDEAVGSALLGQSFEGPEWFHPRPSVAGEGYDPLASGGSNLGTESQELIDAVAARQAQVAATEGVGVEHMPADAVAASASGLDPHISPDYARIQIPRIAEARGLSADAMRDLVERHTEGRVLGVLGDPRVDVLAINLQLEQIAPRS